MYTARQRAQCLFAQPCVYTEVNQRSDNRIKSNTE